jgi:hypothetical protein
VIHRDIKPSNLLLDSEGVVWLTDFGLAKRADEATLTLSGALMGTPRYMSPEQAESLQQTIDHRTDLYSLGASYMSPEQAESLQRPVDHRTDVYSLGATLYELATGRPVFEAATPHGVLARILTEEPVWPRQVRPELPRDLETIILTCLSKDPAQRYPSAQALADDLRAGLDGRPLQARRAGLAERAVRYVRKHQKAIAAGAIGVAATLLLLLGTVLGWRSYSEWRLGRVVLTTEGPPLTAQVLPDADDEPLGEPFAIGTHTALSLPAGDYRLRVKGTGRLGQTYRFGINRGETRSHRLSLEDGLLLGSEPIAAPLAGDALTVTPGKSDLVEWTGQTFIRRDGTTGKPIWDASRPAKPWPPERDPVAWMRRLAQEPAAERPVVLVRPAPDLDGDGTGDLVWVINGTLSFLAVSGRDGSLLWADTIAFEGSGGADSKGAPPQRPNAPTARLGRFLGNPIVADIDGDGTSDLIATFVIFEDYKGAQRSYNDLKLPGVVIVKPPLGRRAVVAVSGRSGRRLWTHALDTEFTDLRPEPRDEGPTLVLGRGGSIVAVPFGSRWIALDPATGKARGQAIDLGFEPERAVQHADLDGDGEVEALALGRSVVPGQRGSGPRWVLAAFSSRTRQPIWKHAVGDPQLVPESLPPEWPLVADLDGDGRTEVLIADYGPFPVFMEYRGLRLLDGATGQTRWVRPMRPYTYADDGLVHLLGAPDLDGDGTRDLIAVSRYDGRRSNDRIDGVRLEPRRVYVDAVSGRDGHSLWFWHEDLAEDLRTVIDPPCWWGRGPDGWPLLAVSLWGSRGPWEPPANPYSRFAPAVVHSLAASTGRELHTIPGLMQPKPADLDGDGIDDLWGSVEGKLVAYHGELPEAWRVLGQFHPAGDFDGDGIDDVLIADLRAPADFSSDGVGSRTAIARSGRDGRILWQVLWALERNGCTRTEGRHTRSGPSAFPAATSTATGRLTSSCAGISNCIVSPDGLRPSRCRRSPVARDGSSGRQDRCRWDSRHTATRVSWDSTSCRPRAAGPPGAPLQPLRRTRNATGTWCLPCDSAGARLGEGWPDRLGQVLAAAIGTSGGRQQ